MENKYRILRYIGFIPASFIGYGLGAIGMILSCKFVASCGFVVDLSGAIDSVTTGVMNDNYISVAVIGFIKGGVSAAAGICIGGWVYGNKSMTGVKIISITFIVCNVLMLAFWRNDYPTLFSLFGEIAAAIYYLIEAFREQMTHSLVD